jgi:hypothetical protein
MRRIIGPSLLLHSLLVLAACHVPMSTDALAADPCQNDHELGRLAITLSCDWQVEKPQPSGSMYWMRNGRNAVLLQIGDIARPQAHFDLDSSLRATFKDRRIPGEISSSRNGKFIHGSRALSGGRGDSLYIYMEDTTHWQYYHFDGELRDTSLRGGLLEAMKGSRLLR